MCASYSALLWSDDGLPFHNRVREELPTIRPLCGSANDTEFIIPFSVKLRPRETIRQLASFVSRFARSLGGSGLLGALLQLGLRQVYVPHRLRDHHSATRNSVIR